MQTQVVVQQPAWLADLHPVAATGLGPIQGLVGALIEAARGVIWQAKTGAHARSHHLKRALLMLNGKFTLDRLTNALTGIGQVSAVRIAQHQGKLFAPKRAAKSSSRRG